MFCAISHTSRTTIYRRGLSDRRSNAKGCLGTNMKGDSFVKTAVNVISKKALEHRYSLRKTI